MDNGIGRLITQLRDKQGVSQAALCKGLCSASTLNRIEADIIYPDPTLLNYLFQRLGTSVTAYRNIYMNADEFKSMEDFRKVSQLLALGKISEAEALLNDMEKRKQFQKKLDRQKLESVRLSIDYRKKNFENRMFRIEQTLKISMPFLEMDKVPQYRLALTEITLLKRIALEYERLMQRTEAINLLYDIKSSIDKYWFDEERKAYACINVIFALTNFLGRDGRYDEALDLCYIGYKSSIKYGLESHSGYFSFNKGYCLEKLGRKITGEEMLKRGYYTYKMVNAKDDIKIAKTYIKDTLGLGL